MEKRNKIITTLNSKRIEIDGENAFMTLANYIRGNESLTGTKVVCAEGDCGACTVLLARNTGSDGKLNFKAVNSCIIPLYLIDGAQVVTVEGLKKEGKELHPVQEAMVENYGAQCGYCTPGFICAMAELAEVAKSENEGITEKKAKNYLTGNLCRCTGYKPIIEAAMKIDLNKMELLKDRFHNSKWLLEMKKINNTPLLMTFNQSIVFLPVTLDQALKAKSENQDLKLVGGSTDIGVTINKGKMITPKVMALYHVEELKVITHDSSFVTVGATATLFELERYIEKLIPELSDLLHIFASPQIKNQGTLVGNIVNGSPIADTIPFLMASDSEVVLKSVKGQRVVLLKDFYLGYKMLDMNPSEIVMAIKIPRLKPNEIIRLYKVSMRKDLDISAVTFAGIIEFDLDKIKNARFAIGGVAATVLRLNDIEKNTLGMNFERETFEKITKLIPTMISPITDLRASKEYRMKLAQNLFLKFYDEINAERVKGATS
jgi:xanthine dehydrogenase small subunit